MGNSKSVKKPKRVIDVKTRVYLYVRAGGRCEFDNCNRYLLEHYPTFSPGNFAEMAHIWAFSSDGPRGNEGVDASDLKDISNLILLCATCHKLVDDHPDRYPVPTLQKFKRAHEDRIFLLTSTKPDRRTVALTLTANIGDQKVDITLPQMQEAVSPLYVNPREVLRIDITNLSDQGTEAYWSVSANQIREQTRRLYEQPFEDGPATHISVFALAPIPLLIFLGSCLSNKIATSLFQRHRHGETWTWKEGAPIATYSTGVLRRGRDPQHVALVVSLSGRIHEIELPNAIDENFTVYEISLSSEDPHPRFLNTEPDLQAFQATYSDTIREIVANQGGVSRLHVFPAVPAPVAVAMGRDLLPKRDPALLIYDYDKRADGFFRTLEVNPS